MFSCKEKYTTYYNGNVEISNTFHFSKKYKENTKLSQIKDDIITSIKKMFVFTYDSGTIISEKEENEISLEEMLKKKNGNKILFYINQDFSLQSHNIKEIPKRIDKQDNHQDENESISPVKKKLRFSNSIFNNKGNAVNSSDSKKSNLCY